MDMSTIPPGKVTALARVAQHLHEQFPGVFGQEAIDELVVDSYAKLAEVMSRYQQQVPMLLFCFLTPRREQAARRALAASTDSLSLHIATAAIDPRVTYPAGQVWMQLHRSCRQVRLIDLEGDPFEAASSANAADPYR